MLRTPGPYAAWVSWLDAFARGENLPSAHLSPIDGKLGPQMLSRLVAHVAGAFEARQRGWSDTLVRDQQLLTVDPTHAHTVIATILNDARSRLAPLVALTGHPAFPPELRESLRTALEQTVRSAQQSLEDSAREAPAELRNAIRQNSLLPALTRPAPAAPGVAARGAPAQGRRIILK